MSFFQRLFGKAKETVEDSVLSKHEEMLIEYVTLENQYRLTHVRGIMVTYEDGSYSPVIRLPEQLQMDIYRKMHGNGVLVEGNWYDSEWMRNSILDFVSIEYNEMYGDWIEDAVSAFKHAMNHARINGSSELVIYGSPWLIYALMGFMDTIEVYVNTVGPNQNTVTECSAARLLITSVDVANKYDQGIVNTVVTKQFKTPSYNFYNLVNLKPLEINSGE